MATNITAETVTRTSSRGWFLTSVAGIAALVLAELSWHNVQMPALVPLLPALRATHAVESYWYGLPDGRRTEALYNALTALPTPGTALLLAALYALWAYTALRRSMAVGRFSLLAVLVAALASAVWYATSWSYGLRYQGAATVLVYLAFSTGTLALLGGVALRARRRPSPLLNLAFHWLSFAWLVVLAFPTFGETP